MTSDALFLIISFVPFPGWLSLILAPRWKWTKRLVASCVLTNILSGIYLYLIIMYFRGSLAGMYSLANIQAQMQNPHIANAAWAHFLGFDLFVGGWEAREARRVGISHALVVPCLVMTYSFGPIGLLLFFALRTTVRWLRSERPAANDAAMAERVRGLRGPGRHVGEEGRLRVGDSVRA
jgi:hypothetical protein